MINAIDLKTGKNNEYFNNLGGSLIILSNLKHINVFVGENNSGKSRIMRSLFLNNSAETLYDSPNSIKEFNNISSSIKHSFNRLNLINSQYSISTNHESLSPCELYSFYKNQYDYYDIRNILNQLGVNNSSVFMSNCTIWVEGLSDKVYSSKYLKTYIESDTQFIRFKEGVDYSFVEYGGNNIVHWGFTDVDSDDDKIKASGITNRAFIIVDNDNDRSNKRKRKEHLEALFGNRYLELSVREIENTIGNKLLEKTLFAGEPVYNKGVITTDSIENKSTIVWEYIDSHYDTGKKYYSGNRNLPNVPKLAFAKQVCSKIESIDDLSTTAKKVAKIIYDFIYNVNQEIN